MRNEISVDTRVNIRGYLNLLAVPSGKIYLYIASFVNAQVSFLLRKKLNMLVCCRLMFTFAVNCQDFRLGYDILINKI